MTGNILDSDPRIRELRMQVDVVDIFRACNVAAWIGATVIKLDKIEGDQLTTDEKAELREPISTIQVLTERRDTLTDQIGLRKKELEEEHGETVPVNQEGRWNLVKGTYVAAIKVECEQRCFNEEQRDLASLWMGHYAENEHARSKERQESLRANVNTERQSA